jgi:hypothetical protein
MLDYSEVDASRAPNVIVFKAVAKVSRDRLGRSREA